MKTLDLGKLYNVLCTVMDRQHLLEEEGKYYKLLNGNDDFYSGIDFESFILKYSFSFTPLDYHDRTGVESIHISNSYWLDRDYEVSEYIYIPVQLLSMSPGELEEWIENRIRECEVEREDRKEQVINRLKMEIEHNQQELKRLEYERNSRKIN